MLKRTKIFLELLLSPNMILSALKFKVFSIASYKLIHMIRSEQIDPELIIDVGANKGQFGITAASIFPKSSVYSFEPDPDVFAVLVENTCTYKNIKCFQTALGSEEGEIEFNRNSYSLSSSILPLTEKHLSAFPKAIEKEVIKISLTTLDKISAEFDLTKTVLLKLDVQGYEKMVLEGGRETLKKIDYVVLEASFKPLYEGEMLFSECLAVMQDYGFEIITPIGYLKDPRTEKILQMDLLFRNTRTN